MANEFKKQAEGYSAQLDKAFEAKSVVRVFEKNNLGVSFVGKKSVIIPEVTFYGMVDYNRNDGFVESDVIFDGTPYTLEMDRGRTLSIDRMDMDETGIANLAGTMLGEYVRTKAVPECDAFCLAKLAKIAESKKNITAFNSSEPFKAFYAMAHKVYNKAGYDEELVCFVSGSVLAALESSDENHKILNVTNGDGSINTAVRKINGITLIPVPDERMKTAFTFSDSEDPRQGGFAVDTEVAKNIDMLMLPKKAATLVKKTEKMRIFTADENQKKDAYKFDYRIYYDIIVTNSKADTIQLAESALQ